MFQTIGVANILQNPVSGFSMEFTLYAHKHVNIRHANTRTYAASIIASTSTVLVLLLVLIPVMMLLAHKNQATRSVLVYGWFPVISAMVISR